jgi:predicted DNA binding protein
MRRLTIELSLDELNRFDGHDSREHASGERLRKIKSFEILQFLKDNPDEFAFICRVEFDDETSKIEDFMDEEILELQALDRNKGATTYFIRSKPSTQAGAQFNHLTSGGYLTVPFEIREGKARLSFLGNAKQIKTFLEGIERQGVKFNVVGMTDARFAKDSPLTRLTEKQRNVLVSAYRLGYYDEPRKISSLDLARRMKIGSSTLINHRRRAERRLLKELIGK